MCLAPTLDHIGQHVPLERVYVLPGNHDFYHHVLDGEARLEAITNDAGAQYAQKQQVFIGGTRFLCCTLWTDFALNGDVLAAFAEARRRMNDHRYIRMANAKYWKIRPEETRDVHRDHLNWLETALATPFAGKTIVVTHHGPLPEAVKTEDPLLRLLYSSDWSSIIESYEPDTWFFGHTHIPFSVQQGKTQVTNASLGYPDQIADGDLETALSQEQVSIFD